MGFVGNYAPCGLSPQTDGMPVIHQKMPHETASPVTVLSMFLRIDLQMLIPRDPVIVLEQERFNHRSQLHVQVEEVNSKCYDKQSGACKQQIQQRFQCFLFHR